MTPKNKKLGKLKQVVVTKDDEATADAMSARFPSMSQSELYRLAIQAGMAKAVEKMTIIMGLKTQMEDVMMDASKSAER